MALNNKSVEKAKQILADMMGWSCAPFDEHDPERPFKSSTISVEGRVGDGWECVFLNVENIEKDHLDYFYAHKHEVPNSHFISFKEYKEHGIVRIGWF